MPAFVVVPGRPFELVGEVLWGFDGSTMAGSYGRNAKRFVDRSKLGLAAEDEGVKQKVGRSGPIF